MHYGKLIRMHRYFLVLDSKNRIVFKKKLEKAEDEKRLTQEYHKLDYSLHFLEGKTLASALEARGIKTSADSAFYIKRDLKEELFFTDKTIKEFLGQPDRIE